MFILVTHFNFNVARRLINVGIGVSVHSSIGMALLYRLTKLSAQGFLLGRLQSALISFYMGYLCGQPMPLLPSKHWPYTWLPSETAQGRLS